MQTYTSLRTQYGIYTKNASSTNLTQGDILINNGYRFLMAKTEWSFLDKTSYLDTAVGSQYYNLPANCKKVRTISLINGNIRYPLQEITTVEEWNFQNRYTNIQSNVGLHYYIKGEVQGGQQFGVWPIPSTVLTNGLELVYTKTVKDLNIADYTTGTIVSIANGAKDVIGSGTSWNSSHVGDFIKITETASANGGDGVWYEIAAVTDTTHLTLVNNYLGNSISAGSASYIIATVPLLPEEYQILPVYYAAAQYWLTIGEDKEKFNYFKGLFDEGEAKLLSSYGSKDSNPVLMASCFSASYKNPNNYPIA